MLKRKIPSSGEMLPVLGIGTWKRFDVSPKSDLGDLQQVLQLLHQSGGRMIDSSPMYGYAEEVIGVITERMVDRDEFFYASKVWTVGKEAGIDQMNESMEKMKRKTIDLMQIHNLVDWQVHLQTLRRWKEQGIVKYIGITHYTDSMHDDLVRIIKREPIDFVQFNYSLLSRHAEETLLPVAAEKGVATIINRPFGEGAWFNKMRGKNLPPWAADYGITSWSQFFLKFIIGHPAVTCVIPATSNPEHMQENCAATEGTLPDDKARAKMAAWVSEW